MAESQTLMPEVSLTVDLLPLIMLLAIALCSASLMVVLRQRPVVRHSLYWSVGGCVATTGLLLIITRGYSPAFVSILLGNWFLLIGEAFLAAGASQYGGRSPKLEFGVGILSICLFATAYFVEADILLRVTIYTLACSFFSVSAAVSFFKAGSRWIDKAAGTIASLLFLVEISRAALIYVDVLSPADKSMINGFSVAFGVPLSILIGVSVLAINWRSIGDLFYSHRDDPALKKNDDGAILKTNSVPLDDPEWIILSNRSMLIAPDGKAIRLTGNEYLVLQKLSEAGDAVERLALNSLIGRSEIDPKDRGIDILFSRLRRKCAEAGLELPVNALRSRGYIFLGKLRMQ